MSFRNALIAAALISTLGSAHAAPKTALTLAGLAQDVGQLDPHLATNVSDRGVVAWIFNGLVRFKPGSINPAEIEPDLAESWESSPDKKVWTFKLRHGVKWHGDFGDFDAQDVVFSLEKAGDPKRSAFASDYRNFEKVEALDPYTVRITLKNPVPSMLGLLTNYSGGFIVSKKAVEAKGVNFTREPIGTGPFRLTSIEPGQALHLASNESYFRGVPKIKEVTYRLILSNSSRDLAFQSGEIDAAAGVQNQAWLNRSRQIPGAVVDIFDPAEMTALHLNVTVKPLDDIRVRQAIAHAIDRSAYVKFQGADYTREALSAIPSDNLGFTADSGELAYDPAKTKALLAEAGYADGLKIEAIASHLPQLEGIAQVLQAQLKRANITLELKLVEHATYHQMIRQDLSPATLYGAARFPVADFYLTQFYHSRSTVKSPTAVTNFSHCSVADREIDAARSEVDSDKQIALWQEAQRKIIANICAVPIIETTLPWIRKQTLDWGYPLKGSMSLGPLLTENTHFTE